MTAPDRRSVYGFPHPAEPPALAAPPPAGVDISVPSAARMYDYYLGGSHFFSSDREAAEHVLRMAPWVKPVAHHNRAFLRRVVQHLCRAGIRQFLDIGSGIPTVGNVHQIAQELAPEARVAYVDIDTVAVAHAQDLLRGNDLVVAVPGDLRRPDLVLGHPDITRLLDFNEPVGLLMVSVLLFIPDSDRPRELLDLYLQQLASGSYLAISHPSTEHAPPQWRASIEQVAATYANAGQPLLTRDRAQIQAWLAAMDLVDPGVVFLPDWRPDTRPDTEPAEPDLARTLSYGALARKR